MVKQAKEPAKVPTKADMKFLIDQLQVMEWAQDTARIAKIAKKYGIPHFANR